MKHRVPLKATRTARPARLAVMAVATAGVIAGGAVHRYWAGRRRLAPGRPPNTRTATGGATSPRPKLRHGKLDDQGHPRETTGSPCG